MASAILIDNQADGKVVSASSQALTMPVSNLLSPEPQVRWRSLTNAASIFLDKGALLSADVAALFGLTCGVNSTVRIRRSTVDPICVVADAGDTGNLSTGSMNFDVTYASVIHRLSAPVSYRYTRVDITDPDKSYVEAGCIVDGLSEGFEINFAYGGTTRHTDRSRKAKTAGGGTLTWRDNTFRSFKLPYNWIPVAQRFGVWERLMRVKGTISNVLLIKDVDSTNLPRDSIYGLVSEQTPFTDGPLFDLYGTELNIEERI